MQVPISHCCHLFHLKNSSKKLLFFLCQKNYLCCWSHQRRVMMARQQPSGLLVLVMVTISASFVRFGFSACRSCFISLRLQFEFVTLLADRMPLYTYLSTTMSAIFPSSSVPSTRLRNSICAPISSIMLCFVVCGFFPL